MDNTLESLGNERKNEIASRLKILAGERSTRDTAKRWNVSLGTLNAYLHKGTMPSFERMIDISIAEGVSLQWLATGSDTVSQEATAIKRLSIVKREGGKYVIEQTAFSEAIYFPMKWLQEKSWLGLSDELFFVENPNNAMEPSIEKGDELLIAPYLSNPAKEVAQGLFLLEIEDAIEVRRLRFDIASNGYHLLSDNSDYPNKFVASNEINKHISIIGEVVRVIGKPNT